MSLLFTVRWLLPKIGIFGPSASTIIGEELRIAMEETVLIGQREVAVLTPVGATGLLRGGIMSEVRGSTAQLRGVVVTTSGYALPVEEGSRPHWAPIGPLLLWARRKLGDEQSAYRVRWAIHVRGTKAVHMFRDGGAIMRQRAPGIFQRALLRIRQRLGGA